MILQIHLPMICLKAEMVYFSTHWFHLDPLQTRLNLNITSLPTLPNFALIKQICAALSINLNLKDSIHFLFLHICVCLFSQWQKFLFCEDDKQYKFNLWYIRDLCLPFLYYVNILSTFCVCVFVDEKKGCYDFIK